MGNRGGVLGISWKISGASTGLMDVFSLCICLPVLGSNWSHIEAPWTTEGSPITVLELFCEPTHTHTQFCEPTQSVLRTITLSFANLPTQSCEPTQSVLRTYTHSFANLHNQFCEPTHSVLRTYTLSFSNIHNLHTQVFESTHSVLRTYTISVASLLTQC